MPLDSAARRPARLSSLVVASVRCEQFGPVVDAEFQITAPEMPGPSGMFLDLRGARLSLQSIECDVARVIWPSVTRRVGRVPLILRPGASWNGGKVRLRLHRQPGGSVEEGVACGPVVLPNDLPSLNWPLLRGSTEVGMRQSTLVRLSDRDPAAAVGSVPHEIGTHIEWDAPALQIAIVGGRGCDVDEVDHSWMRTTTCVRRAASVRRDHIRTVHRLLYDAAEFVADSLELRPGVSLVAHLDATRPHDNALGAMTSAPRI